MIMRNNGSSQSDRVSGQHVHHSKPHHHRDGSQTCIRPHPTPSHPTRLERIPIQSMVTMGLVSASGHSGCQCHSRGTRSPHHRSCRNRREHRKPPTRRSPRVCHPHKPTDCTPHHNPHNSHQTNHSATKINGTPRRDVAPKHWQVWENGQHLLLPNHFWATYMGLDCLLRGSS